MSPRLSAVIITRDEERDLPDCLESVKLLADEIVVLDDRSSDSTREIAERFGAKVSTRDFDGYAAQKQAALELAAGDWVLSIDADERLTAELAEEIRGLVGSDRDESLPRHSPAGKGELDGAAGYEIPFEVRFMGRRLRFGGLGSERHLRLFRRSAGRFVGGLVHEGVEVDGRVERLRGRMLHIPYRDIGEYIGKMRVYTDSAARKKHAAGKRFSVLHHLLPFWEFFSRAFLRLGVLDGTPGIVWAGLSSFHTWTKYMRLRELCSDGGDI